MPYKKMIFILIAGVILNEIRLGYFRNFLRPLHAIRFRQAAWIIAAIAGLIAALCFVDPLLVRKIQEFTVVREWIPNFGRAIGRNNHFWYTLIIIYLGAALSRNPVIRRRAFGIIVSSAFCAIIVTGLKFTFLRARPSAGLGSLRFFNLEGLTKDMSDFQSFPSGDVSLVAGASLYLFFLIRNAWIRWLFLILPLTTALSRIHLNRHWPSDTVGSILIALFIGWWISKHSRASAKQE